MWQSVVMGMGGTVDYEINWNTTQLERLAQDEHLTAAYLDPQADILTERDLLRSLLGFLREGRGGERFVADIDIIERFAQRFSLRITLGGTCVRAAIAMDVVGMGATLHLVSIDDHVRRLLPPRCDYVCSATEDSTFPHLIVQYPRGAAVNVAGEKVGKDGPNRVIFANDPPHRELVLSPQLGQALAGARVVLISGFNVIQDPATLAARLQTLLTDMGRLPQEAVVFFEDAGYHRADLRHQVRRAVAAAVDVFSMNEDELSWYVGRDVDLLSVPDAVASLGEVHAAVGAPTVVVHTRYWAAAVGERAKEYEAALASGIQMASARYCYGDGYGPAQLAEVAAMPRVAAARAVCDGLHAAYGDYACVVPALDLRGVPVPTTIGLGDTFVGGFIAALVDPARAAQGWPVQDGAPPGAPPSRSELSGL